MLLFLKNLPLLIINRDLEKIHDILNDKNIFYELFMSIFNNFE